MTMVGSIRSVRVTLTSISLVAGWAFWASASGIVREPASQAGAGPQSGKAAADTPNAKTSHEPASPDRSDAAAAFFAQPGDDPPRPFVPLRASTVADRNRLEAVRLYSAARALEDRRAWSDAVALLQDALKLDPDSIAIARRLSRIYIGALGRPDLALEYGKRVLALEPGDSETLAQIVEYYKKNEPAAALALLNEVLSNPRLDPHAPARLLANFELGQLYTGRLHQTDKAADAFAKVLDALDDKSANRLTPSDQFRVLGEAPALAYLGFGQVFLGAKRPEFAVRAFERALVYDEDNSQISLILADTLLKLKKGDQALALVERTIARQTAFLEAYELLGKVLKALNRDKEITPRLEAAARRDSKNVPLQYVLADRYRETGETDKAEALYKELLTSQPTPQTFAALARSLLKRKKATDLLKVMSDAWARPESQKAIRPQLQEAAVDDAMTEAMLEAGLKQSGSNPAALSRAAYQILSLLANNPGRDSRNKIRRLEMLVRLQRLLAEQKHSEVVYAEIIDTLRRMGRHAEAATAIEQLIAKYPNARTVPTLTMLADLHRRAGHIEAAKTTLLEAMKLDAADGMAQYRLAGALSDLGLPEDAARVLKAAAKREAANPLYELYLGVVLTRYGRNDEAIKVFESLLKRFGDNQELIKDLRPLLSVVYVNLGDFAKAESELEHVLQSFPDEAGPNNDLGYLYAEQGKNLEKAEVMIRKALATTGDDAESYRAYMDSLGWVLFKRGKPKEALDALKKAAEIMMAAAEKEGSNPDPTILEHLGDVHFQLQELDKAGDAWRQAAKAAQEAIPPDKRLPEIRKKLAALEQLGPLPKPSSSRTP
jgi:tetratricopeptide (TPR) repeat protein